MRIALCAHPTSASAREQQAACARWLASRDVEAVLVDSNQLQMDSSEFNQLVQQTTDIALVCALGGDGTILRATRLAYMAKVPLLGVNFGNLGFLSGATSQALFPALEAFLAHQLLEDCRVMLKAEVSFNDGSKAGYTALNEVLLSRSALGKIIVVDIAVNGNVLPSARGDGVIVATATGSTAYALSAGGPILTPDNQGLCIVPVCGLGFNAAALVSAPSDVIRLTAVPQSDQHPLLIIDGQLLETASSDIHVSSVEVAKAERDMVFLRYDTPDFYTRMAHSLAGGNHAR